MKKHETSSEDVKQVRADLDDLMKSFNLLKEEKISNTEIKQQENKKIISGGVDLIIDEKTYNEIKNKIITLRKNYTLNN